MTDLAWAIFQFAAYCLLVFGFWAFNGTMESFTYLRTNYPAVPYRARLRIAWMVGRSPFRNSRVVTELYVTVNGATPPAQVTE